MTMTAQDIIQNAIDADPGLVESTGFVRYDPATGEITQTGRMARSLVAGHQDAGEPYAPVAEVPMGEQFAFMASHYVDLTTKAVMPKAPFPGVLTGLIFTGLPVPCRVSVAVPFQTGQGHWAPMVYDVTDADLELEFDIPDTYRVVVESATHVAAEFTVVFSG